MSSILGDLEAVLAEPAVLTASVAEGYPYGDVAALGMAAVVVTDGDPLLARDAATWLGQRIWARRAAMDPPVVTVEDAVWQAARSDRTPVLILDSGDNIGGGSGGDSTALIHETVRQAVHPTLVLLNDPTAVAACDGVPVGGRVSLSVGGRVERHSPPLPLEGTLSHLGPGAFRGSEPAHAGLASLDPGRTAVVSSDQGDTIVLTSSLVMPTSLRQVLILGIEPRAFRAIVAKGVQSPRPAYEPVSGDVVVAASPGATTLDLRSLPYRRRRRPLWPFESPADPPPATWAPG
jgi:microcystin degradation protein MlrC